VILMLAAAGGGFAVVCVLGWGLVAAGLRAGDRPGDAAVAAVLVPGPRPAIIATVRNPGDVPVVAGLTVRRPLLPGWPGAGWPGAGLTVRVPRRTTPAGDQRARRQRRPSSSWPASARSAGSRSGLRTWTAT
jgi:hypothetical protein